jgi:tetratricopeptide (TPR) repeat protein
MDLGKSEEAAALLDPICTDLKSAPVGALYLNGKACQSLGKTTRAAELLKAAVARQSDFADAYHALGSILCDQAQQKEGVPFLENAVKLNPNSGAIRYSLALAYFNDVSRSDHLALARTTFEATLDRDPQNEWAHYYYGLTLEQQSDLEAAVREYDRTLEINAAFDSAIYRKAAVLTQLGKREEAKSCYALFDKRSKEAITNVHDKRRNNSIVDTAEEHYRRGMALMQKGDKNAARDDFKIALQREPGNSVVRRALQGLGGL